MVHRWKLTPSLLARAVPGQQNICDGNVIQLHLQVIDRFCLRATMIPQVEYLTEDIYEGVRVEAHNPNVGALSLRHLGVSFVYNPFLDSYLSIINLSHYSWLHVPTLIFGVIGVGACQQEHHRRKASPRSMSWQSMVGAKQLMGRRFKSTTGKIPKCQQSIVTTAANQVG
ncbi:uncharacterized protein LOC126617636 isoform X2 [Malus sylvestris]|uniref:uncharacterized protein LOC126617636 isoform X2 n=1 Tax=Malus sylvestris TaxID=3752 RepID=UPI0021AD4CE5|nr:uncharacterized protein LOC126617636 isoform X2 [Malus sylvestris]